MELKKESIQMLRIKNKAAAQATFDEDYNVPDVKPDIGRLVQSKADVSMEEVRLSEGRALLKGDRKSTRLNSSHRCTSRMPSSA